MVDTIEGKSYMSLYHYVDEIYYEYKSHEQHLNQDAFSLLIARVIVARERPCFYEDAVRDSFSGERMVMDELTADEVIEILPQFEYLKISAKTKTSNSA